MIKVLLFAQLQETAGTNEVELDTVPGSVKELRGIMKEKYGFTTLESAMTAVNEEYADEDTELKDGDTVAFIPPVSGG
ncbi:molybdopterin converting factor subunit 1 [Bacillus marinisedimentorum]|uniref:molybdopterin converting factor subunit 1 n=1 Tax=Bacillus marinisedimentorum TaxID=1821260 RepID=UPI00087253F3|nr:molybdopterin converting factor subunit 1 [Bacillus marinisedimentorum]